MEERRQQEAASASVAVQCPPPISPQPQAEQRAAGEEQAAADAPALPTVKEAVDKFISERSKELDQQVHGHGYTEAASDLLQHHREGLTFAEFARNRDAMRHYHKVMIGIPARYATDREYRGLGWDALVALEVPRAAL